MLGRSWNITRYIYGRFHGMRDLLTGISQATTITTTDEQEIISLDVHGIGGKNLASSVFRSLLLFSTYLGVWVGVGKTYVTPYPSFSPLTYTRRKKYCSASRILPCLSCVVRQCTSMTPRYSANGPFKRRNGTHTYMYVHRKSPEYWLDAADDSIRPGGIIRNPWRQWLGFYSTARNGESYCRGNGYRSSDISRLDAQSHIYRGLEQFFSPIRLSNIWPILINTSKKMLGALISQTSDHSSHITHSRHSWSNN